MAVETVDTRVVEARFDSKQFEKGVDKTVKKLDELKKSLNLKDTGKSVADLGDKISESTSKASDSLEKLQNRFTSFTGMLKQKLLGGIADEIVGVFFKLKNSFESLVSSMSTAQISRGMQRYTDILTSVRTLTAAGVSESAAYESIERLGLYADQTSYSLDELVSTMSKFKTAGASLDTARRMVEGLSNAAASMGVNAQQAARAYLNLQQAYSKGKMTQADWISFESLPMVGEKFNQAILDAAEKVGTLKKNAKGTYEVVSKAVKAGGGVGGRVSGAAAKGITAENMGSKLASGWFNKKVMEEVFGNTYYFEEIGIAEVNKIKKKEEQIKADLRKEVEKGIIAEKDFDKKVTEKLQEYFDETNKASLEEKKKEIAERKKTKQLEYDAAVKDLKGDERKKAMEEYRKSIAELDKELKDFENAHHLSAFAYQAFRAGQEARSFTDVLNTLKDAISRGWATSFELIFGKLDEASAFFTKLTESQFAEGIYAIGEFRNAILESWRNNGGREDMLSVLEYMDDLAGSIFKKLGLITDEEDYFNKHFDEHKYMALNQRDPEAAEQYKQSIQNEAADHSPFEDMAKELGQRLSIVGRNIKDFFEGVKKWFTEADTTGVSRLQRITNIINNFSNVFTGAATAVGMGLEFIGNIYLSFKTTFDHLWQALDKLTQKFFSLFNPKASQEGLTVFRAIEDTFNNILKVFQDLDEPLGKIIDVLTDIISFAIDIGAGTVVGNIQFFADAFGLLLELLGIGSSQQDRKAGVLDGITKDIASFGEVCKSAIKSIGEFFDSIFKDLRIFLGLDKENKLKEGGIFANIQNFFKTNEFVKTVKDWIDNAIKDVTAFISSIPGEIAKLPSIIGEFFSGLFYEKKAAKGFYKYQDTRTPLKRWLDQAILDVRNFIKFIPGKLKKIPNIINEFFKNLLYTGFYKDSKGNKTWVKKPFVQWVDDNLIKPLSEFVKNLPTYIGQGIGKVFNFVKTVVGAIFGKENGEPVVSTDIENELQEPFSGINLNGVLETIKDIGKKILNGIISAFTGNLDWENNKDWIQTKVANAIDGIRKKAEEVWPKVRDWFVNLPESIANFFKGEDGTKNESTPIGSAISAFIKSVGEWLSSIPDTLLTVWENIEKQSGTIWDSIIGWITGNPKDTSKLKSEYQSYYDDLIRGGAFSDAEDYKKFALYQQWRDDNPIAANIQDFFSHLVEFFGKKIAAIPGQIKDAWESAVTVATIVWDVITGQYDPDDPKDYGNPIFNKIEEFVGEFAIQIATKFKELPSKLKGAWDTAVDIGKMIKNVVFGNTGKPLFDEATYNSILFGTNNASEKWSQDVREKMAELYKNSTTDYTNGNSNNPLYKSIESFFDGIVKWIVAEANSLPNKIRIAWGSVVDISKTIGEVIFGTGKPVFDKNMYNKMLGADGHGTAAAEAYKNSVKDFGNPIINSISLFFEKIRDWVRESINKLPSLIAEGWTVTKTIGLVIWDIITGQYESKKENQDDELYNDIGTFIESFAKKVGFKLKEIPDKIKSVIGTIGDIATIIKNVIFHNTGKPLFDEATYNSILFGTNNASEKWSQDVRERMAELYKNSTTDYTEGESNNPLYKSIESFFNGIVNWIRDQITSLPDKIRNLWSTAKDIGSIIRDTLFGSAHVVDEKEIERLMAIDPSGYAAKMYKDSATEYDNPLYTSLANFFVRVRDWIRGFITDLPGNISKGWDAAVDFIKVVGEPIINGISSAVEWISTSLANITNWLNGDERDKSKPFFEQVTDYFTDPVTGEEDPIWTAIKKLGQNIRDMLVPTIIDFIKSAVEEIKTQAPNILSGIFSFIGGGSSKEKKELEKEITPYGEYINDYYTKKYASKEAAITKGLQEYSDKFDGMTLQLASMNPLDWSWDKSAIPINSDQTGTAINNATDIVSQAGGFLHEMRQAFSDFTGNDVAQWAIFLGLIATVIYALSDLADNLFFLDDAIGYNMKWLGIGSMLTALAGILVWCTYLASTGDEDTLTSVYGIFDKILEFIDRIAEIFLKLKALEISDSIIQLVSSFFDWRAAVKGTGATGGSLLGSFLNKVLLIVGISEGSEILSTGLENTFKNFAQTFHSIAQGTDDLIKAISDIISVVDKIDPAKEAIGKIGELFQTLREVFTYTELVSTASDMLQKEVKDNVAIVNGIEMIGEFYTDQNTGIEMFASAVDDTVVEASQVSGRAKRAEYVTKNITDDVLRITRLFTRLSGAIAEFKNAISLNENAETITTDIQTLLGMTEQMKIFGEFGQSDDFENFKTAFTSLGAAVSLYSLGDFKGFTSETTISSAISLLTELFGNDEFNSLIATFSDFTLPDGATTLDKSERMVIFAGALASIAKACKDLDDDSGKNIETLFATVSKIPVSEYNGKKIDELSIQFGELGNAIGAFAINTEDLKSTNIENAQTALDMLLRLAIGLKDIPSDTVLSKAFTGDKSLENFGLGIEALGNNLKDFFGYIENLNSYGVSVTYNKKNLSMAIYAVQGISEGIYILSRAPYLNAFKQNFEGGLTDALGNLSKLGQNIIGFIDEINKYQFSGDGNVDWSRIYNVIDSISKVSDSIAKVPNKYYSTGQDIGGRMDTLGKILFGDYDEHGNIRHYGIVGHLTAFIASAINAVKDVGYADNLSDASSIISGYATLTEQIVQMLIGLGKIQYGDLIAEYYKNGLSASYDISYLNPFDIILPVFQGINDNFSIYQKFLNNAATFNQEGITTTTMFFDGLYSLTYALDAFSKKNEKTGEYVTTEGLTKLLEFNWESLGIVLEEMNSALAPSIDVASPIISSLDTLKEYSWSSILSDDFYIFAEQFRNALGILSFDDKNSTTALSESLNELASFKWEDVNTDFTAPTITPVLNLEDQNFKDQIAKMHQMLGFTMDETGMLVNPELTFNNNLDLPKLDDISNKLDYLNTIALYISQLKETADQFNTSLSSMQFIINGEEFTKVIGPTMDRWLGTEGFYAARLIT